MPKDLWKTDKKKRIALVGKWAKHMKRQFSEKQIRKAKKYVTRHSGLTIIRERQSIKLSISQTSNGPDSWKKIYVGSNVGIQIQGPLCPAAHGVVGRGTGPSSGL